MTPLGGQTDRAALRHRGGTRGIRRREPTVVAADAMPPDQIGFDIGPDSARVFAGVIRHAKTVFWNGPMGVAEWESFAAGTRAVAQALTEVDGLTVVGGGDWQLAVRDLGFGRSVRSHLDRRRGQSGVSRGQDTAGLGRSR